MLIFAMAQSRRRMASNRLLWIWFGFLVLWPGVQAWSQKAPAPSQPLKVAVYVQPPFVTKTANGYGGFAVELWESIARDAGWKWNYLEVPTLVELLDLVANGKADVAVTDLSITSDRLKRMDFTLPYFDAGLQIMINSNRPIAVRNLWQGLEEDGHLKVLLGAAICIIVLSFILTVIDRQWDPDFHDAWTHGWAESFYHVTSLIFTGKASHKGIPGPLGRVIAGIWIVCGVALISYITAGFTSVLTANRIQNHIEGPENLSHKTVGTLAGSSAETYCRKAMFDTQTFDNLGLAVQALVKKQVDAIIFDAPILAYYDKSHPELPITEVGPIFEPDKYGFALPLFHPGLRTLNQGIAAMIEDGRMAELKSKYFETN